MYESAVAAGPKTWNEVEDGFLRAMEAFDSNIAGGIADMGDLQNGKGDFFNDLLALLLENCADIELFSRGDVPGLIFPKHMLDVTYPSVGVAQFLLEAKAVGTPKHPGSPRQIDAGRAGSADLDKRVKEIAFKTIDLKAEYARIMTQQGKEPGQRTGDLTSWLRSVKPLSYLSISARVISDNDLERVQRFARVAGQVTDAVGVYCFRPDDPKSPSTYRRAPVGPDIEMERVLYRACENLTAMKGAEPVVPTTPSPAEATERPDVTG